MTDKTLEVVELYPKIFVYKNLFNDIDQTFKLLKESTGGDDEILSPWTQWSIFGEYLSPAVKNYEQRLYIEGIKEIKTETEKQEKQKMFLLELVTNFHIATKDYIFKNSVILDQYKVVPDVLDKNGNQIEDWIVSGPSIARYKPDIDDKMAMMYHSDYIREPLRSPGFKFAITALTYFNDDYEGGEIDFIVNGKAFMYKPEAGDILVFPSGHPEILTEDGSVFLHGVLAPKNSSKYLSRMYWMKYDIGEDEWFKKEKEFGKEVGESMQPDIMQKFRDEHPNKFSAEKETRIK